MSTEATTTYLSIFRTRVEVQDIYSDDGRTSQCMYVMYVTGMVINEMVENEMVKNEMVKK